MPEIRKSSLILTRIRTHVPKDQVATSTFVRLVLAHILWPKVNGS